MTLLQRIDASIYKAAGPPDLQRVVSQTVTAAQSRSPQYASWTQVLGEAPCFDRKVWEYVIVLRTSRPRIRPECCARAAAMGFGVGTKPLPAALAARGLEVLATGRPPRTSGTGPDGESTRQMLRSARSPVYVRRLYVRDSFRFRPFCRHEREAWAHRRLLLPGGAPRALSRLAIVFATDGLTNDPTNG